MREIKATIVIDKSAEELFAFTIDPKNTPKWVSSILSEQTDEWPVRLGSVYRNRRRNGEWSEYKVLAFEPSKLFRLRKNDDGLYVEYIYIPLDKKVTKLEYRLQMDKGELDSSLNPQLLEGLLHKLKKVIELPRWEDNRGIFFGTKQSWIQRYSTIYRIRMPLWAKGWLVFF